MLLSSYREACEEGLEEYRQSNQSSRLENERLVEILKRKKKEDKTDARMREIEPQKEMMRKRNDDVKLLTF